MYQKFLKGILWKEGLLFVIAVIAIFQVSRNWEVMMEGASRFFGIVQPFFVGAILAYFLSNPTRRIQDRIIALNKTFLAKRSRGLAVLSIFVIIILIFSGILTWLVPIISDNVTDFAHQLTDYYQQFLSLLNDMSEPGHQWHEVIDAIGLAQLDNILDNIFNQFSIEVVVNQLLQSTNLLLGHALNTISTLFNAIISMIICLYVLLYTDSIKRVAEKTAKSFIKKRQLIAVRSYVQKSNQIFINFISAQFLDACILGTLATIILGILNVRYAVTLGVLLGVANMIPYFGSIFATLLTALITLFTSPDPRQALFVLIALLILQQIDGNFIGPRITGDALGVNPIIIIISITIGGAYSGVLGMFVSVPIAAMLKMFFFDYLHYREQKYVHKIE